MSEISDLARLEIKAAAGRLAMDCAASARFVIEFMEREARVDFGDLIGLRDRDRIVAMASAPIGGPPEQPPEGWLNLPRPESDFRAALNGENDHD